MVIQHRVSDQCNSVRLHIDMLSISQRDWSQLIAEKPLLRLSREKFTESYKQNPDAGGWKTKAEFYWPSVGLHQNKHQDDG